MSILFKGNLEEGNYTLIKSTDGWVLKGETSYAGFNFADRPKGEWIEQEDDYHHYWECSECGMGVGLDDIRNFCPNCGSDNRGGNNSE